MELIAEFEINDLGKMTNQTSGKHWFNRHKERIKWQRLVNEQLTIHNVKPLKLNRAVLTLTRLSSKAPDADGLVSGFKCIIDSLVKFGLLVDDNYKIIGMPNYSWEYRPRKLGGLVKVKVEA